MKVLGSHGGMQYNSKPGRNPRGMVKPKGLRWVEEFLYFLNNQSLKKTSERWFSDFGNITWCNLLWANSTDTGLLIWELIIFRRDLWHWRIEMKDPVTLRGNPIQQTMEMFGKAYGQIFFGDGKALEIERGMENRRENLYFISFLLIEFCQHLMWFGMIVLKFIAPFWPLLCTVYRKDLATEEAWRCQADARYFAAGDISFKPGVFCGDLGNGFPCEGSSWCGSIKFKERPSICQKGNLRRFIDKAEVANHQGTVTDRTVPVSCISLYILFMISSMMLGVLRCIYGNISEDIGHVHSLWCHVRWCASKDLKIGRFSHRKISWNDVVKNDEIHHATFDTRNEALHCQTFTIHIPINLARGCIGDWEYHSITTELIW